MTLTIPLKSWTDSYGRRLYRLADLPIDAIFQVPDQNPIYKATHLPKSTHSGKRQCLNTTTGKFEYLKVSLKVEVK